MKKNLLLLFIFSISLNVSAQNIQGSWKGFLEVGAVKLRVVFNLTKNGDGSYSSTMDSPDQGAKDLSSDSTSFNSGTLYILNKTLFLDYEGELKGDSIIGLFTQMGVRYKLNLVKGTFENYRPQEPIAPYSYISEDVVVENKSANLKLAGTFTYPKTGSNFPVAILITGSGPQDRNEELMGHKPFLVLSDHLTKRGIAVLRFDDRGVGVSTGVFKDATSENFSTDRKHIIIM